MLPPIPPFQVSIAKGMVQNSHVSPISRKAGRRSPHGRTASRAKAPNHGKLWPRAFCHRP